MSLLLRIFLRHPITVSSSCFHASLHLRLKREMTFPRFSRTASPMRGGKNEGDYLRTSELANMSREAIEEDLIERRVRTSVEAVEAGKSIALVDA
ncbi:unnamed protein product [Nippostrongylus brasiliensis]|uniref:Acyl-CoA_dh_N domain-containing protein n=1 Tax=Nippostrongylus brasiliensis TaxID=27835 RepID=A0A0N4Y7M0_NIPBR|nr:unnamed protein product [Nippostrongylus brasiliensis]